MGFKEIIEFNELSKEEGKKYPKKRYLFNLITSEKGKHFIGIVGPRGVGKTIILKQFVASQSDSFYLSADSLGELDLIQIARILSNQYKIKKLLIDEIHFCKTYAGDLKKIYDNYDIRVIFTSSVSLSLFESSYDLSRRVVLHSLYPFSFREYLLFTQNVEITPLTINDIFENRWTSDHMRYSYLFDDYLKGRLFPFSLDEPDYMPILRNICATVIRKDIPLVYNLRVGDIENIEKLLSFIGKSEVDGINYSSVSKNLGITKYKAELFIKLLARAFVLNPIFPKGTNVLKEPKVLMFLPFRLLYKDWDYCAGAIREDFFAEIIAMKGLVFHYLKTKRGSKTPDFLVESEDDKIIIEIGGKSKGREQFKGIKAGKKLILTHTQDMMQNAKPLSLIGYLV